MNLIERTAGKNREARIRSKLKAHGLQLQKSRDGEYRIVITSMNAYASEPMSTLDEVERWMLDSGI